MPTPERPPPRAHDHALLLALLLSLAAHGVFMLTSVYSDLGDGVTSWPGPRHAQLAPSLQLRIAPPPAAPRPSPAAGPDHPTPAPATPSAAAEAVADADTPAHYQPSQLDGPVLPVSTPDTSRLRHLVFSGQTIRLRLWISARGQVEHIEVLRADEADREAVAEVQAMYYDTAYMPPHRQGQPVAARMDIEMDFMPERLGTRPMALLGAATP